MNWVGSGLSGFSLLALPGSQFNYYLLVLQLRALKRRTRGYWCIVETVVGPLGRRIDKWDEIFYGAVVFDVSREA